MLLFRPILTAGFALIALSTTQAQHYTFELIQVPRASITTPIDINNRGQIVGIVQGREQNAGFLKDGGIFTLIDVPGAGPLNGTTASGINDAGQIVGTYVTENINVESHGFIQSGQALTTFDVPDSISTEVAAINNLGQIVGRFFPGPSLQIGRGFIRNGNGFTFFDAPGVQGPFGTFPYDFNDHGQIVGEFLDVSGFHSFLLQSNNFTLINVPVQGETTVRAINNLGQIAGSFRSGSVVSHGFITIRGRFFQIDVPGISTSFGTEVFGINDSGQVVGGVDVQGVPGVFRFGFVATPCSGTNADCVMWPEIGQVPGPPVIDCPGDIFVPCSSESALAVSYSVTATSEGGPPPVVVCSPPSGSSFPIGANIVRCTASDDSGNQTNCEFRVIRRPLEFTGFLDPLRESDAT